MLTQAQELAVLLEERARRQSRRKLDSFYPEEGPLRRELYSQHLAFFAAGKMHRERLALCANRVGKTEGMGGYETALHLTGDYPDWWPGHRFENAIHAWAAGDTRQTTRDIQQAKLLGPPEAIGTGLIPGDAILKTTPKAGVPEAVESAHVQHATGGTSILDFRSYDQGRATFQGTERDLIWCDEEPPLEVYMECVTRTMATGGFKGGLLIVTFTPLQGMSDVVLLFVPDGELPH